jgi:hypothetical protein
VKPGNTWRNQVLTSAQPGPAAAAIAGPQGHQAPSAARAGVAGSWRWVYLILVIVTLASHLPELSGWVSCNPIFLEQNQGLLAAPVRQWLPGMCTVDGNDGETHQALGGRAAEMWLQGKLPWWNSLAGLGMPLAAEAQPAAFFLPFILLLHFQSGVVWLKLIMQFLTGAFAVALFRELGLARSAACLGAILLSLNGTFAWFAHSHAALPIAFLPALLFGLERCRSSAQAGRPGGPVWVALALAYSIVAGFPETAFMDGLLAAVWAIVALACVRAEHRLRLATKILAGGCVGLALSAPAWISFVDYLNIASIGVQGNSSGDHLATEQAVQLLVPSLYGPPFSDGNWPRWAGGYFGCALTLIALIGLFSGSRLAALRWAMAGWIIFWLCAFFQVPAVTAIWTSFRPLNEVWITRYAMPSMDCAAAVLAALAIDDWRRARHGVRTAWAICVFAALAGVTLTLTSFARHHGINPADSRFFLIAALLETAIVALLLAFSLARPPGRRAVLTVATLVTFDATAQFMVPELAGTLPNRVAMEPIAFLRAHAGLSRVFSLAEQLPINYASWFGVASIQADTLPYPAAWGAAAVAIGGHTNWEANMFGVTRSAELASFIANADRLRAAGTKYVILAADGDPFVTKPEPGIDRVYSDPRTHIYELAHAAPYFETRGGSCQLTTISREHARTRCTAPALLLRRELLLPGWSAGINGGKAPIWPGKGPGAGAGEDFFQLVAVPAGPADIRWRYAPPHANLIAWVFAFGFVGTATMASAGAWAGAAGRKGRLRYLAAVL